MTRSNDHPALFIRDLSSTGDTRLCQWQAVNGAEKLVLEGFFFFLLH